MNRKIRRDLERKLGKEATDEMAEKIFQFNKLPEECSACRQEFDKQNKSMVQSWTVVAREEIVRLFCPECIRKTQEVLDGN